MLWNIHHLYADECIYQVNFYFYVRLPEYKGLVQDLSMAQERLGWSFTPELDSFTKRGGETVFRSIWETVVV